MQPRSSPVRIRFLIPNFGPVGFFQKFRIFLINFVYRSALYSANLVLILDLLSCFSGCNTGLCTNDPVEDECTET